MRKALWIAGGVVVALAAGLTGFWYFNQSTARTQIEAALEQLNQAGVETTYEALEIEGFPIAYEGVLTNLNVKLVTEGVALSFPTVSAGMNLTSIGTVNFVMPQRFTATPLDASGSPLNESLAVESEAFLAAITPQEAGEIDMRFSADLLRLASQAEAGGFLQWREIAALVKLELDRPAQALEFNATFQAEEMAAEAATPELDGVGAASFKATSVQGQAEGSLAKAELELAAGGVVVDAGPGATLRLDGLGFSAALTPEARFDATPIFNLPTGADPTAGLIVMAVEALAKRGAIDASVRLDKLDAQVAAAAAGDDGATVSLGGFEAGSKVNPNEIAIDLKAGSMKVDAQLSGARSKGSVDGLVFAINGAPGRAYDFSPLLNAATYAEGVAVLTDILRGEIALGGATSFRIASDRFETESSGEQVEFGFDRFATLSGANETSISLTSDQASFLLKSDDARYEFSGVAAGAVEVQAFELFGAHPLKKTEEATQPAKLRMVVADVALDEGLWTALALGEQPERLPGLRVDAEVDVTLAGDLMSMPPFLAATALAYPRLTLNEALFDALGFKAEGQGVVQLQPSQAGAILLTLQNWKPFMERLNASALGQNPSLGVNLATADAFVTQFGEPGDASGATVMNFEITDAGVTVNGKPIEE